MHLLQPLLLRLHHVLQLLLLRHSAEADINVADADADVADIADVADSDTNADIADRHAAACLLLVLILYYKILR